MLILIGITRVHNMFKIGIAYYEPFNMNNYLVSYFYFCIESMKKKVLVKEHAYYITETN